MRLRGELLPTLTDVTKVNMHCLSLVLTLNDIAKVNAYWLPLSLPSASYQTTLRYVDVVPSKSFVWTLLQHAAIKVIKNSEMNGHQISREVEETAETFNLLREMYGEVGRVS